MSLSTFTSMGLSGPLDHPKSLTYYDKINLMAKQRSRAISLSLDWANIIKDTENEKERRQAQVYLSGSLVYDKEQLQFCTGSSYSGKWNALGMAVYGQYIYPQGCEYEGGIEDGRFHGRGKLSYPMGQKLEGVWNKGKMISYKFTNVDGLQYNESWGYCRFPDRRFNVSLREGLQPAGREHLTNQQPTREIPPDMYDTGDGFYNAEMQATVMSRDPQDYEQLEGRDSVVIVENDDDDEADDLFWMHAVNIVQLQRSKWIEENCRKGWDEPTGYRPYLYEDWITGRKKELEEMEIKYEPLKTDEESMNFSLDQRIQSDRSSPTFDAQSLEYAGTGRKLTGSKSDLCVANSDKTFVE